MVRFYKLRADTAHLKPQARVVLAVLNDFARDTSECFPKQEQIAERAGLSVRSTKRWLHYLVGAGWLRANRTGRANDYELVDPTAEPAEMAAPAAAAASAGAPPPIGQNWPIREATCGLSDRPELAHQIGQNWPITSLIDAGIDPAAEAGAAAANSSSPENQNQEPGRTEPDEPAALLEALHVPGELARDLVRPDPQFARVAAAWLRQRLADESRPVANPIGFIRGAFRLPASYGFSRGPGGQWQPPVAEGRAAIELARQQRSQAAQERQRLEAEARERSVRAANAELDALQPLISAENDHWAALAAADRADIEASISREQPLFGGRSFDRSTLYRRICVHAMRDRFPTIDEDLRRRFGQARFNGEGGFTPPPDAPPLQELGDVDDALRRINQGGP